MIQLLTALTRRAVRLVAGTVVGILVLPLKGLAQLAAVAAALVLVLRFIGVGA